MAEVLEVVMLYEPLLRRKQVHLVEVEYPENEKVDKHLAHVLRPVEEKPEKIIPE